MVPDVVRPGVPPVGSHGAARADLPRWAGPRPSTGVAPVLEDRAQEPSIHAAETSAAHRPKPRISLPGDAQTDAPAIERTVASVQPKRARTGDGAPSPPPGAEAAAPDAGDAAVSRPAHHMSVPRSRRGESAKAPSREALSHPQRPVVTVRSAGEAGTMPMALRAARAALAALKKGSGEPLEPDLRTEMEPLLGDLGFVRLERGPVAEEVARTVSAEAVTMGHHVFLPHGAPGLGTLRGRALLAHELTHVAQAERAREGGRSWVESLLQRQRIIASPADLHGSRDRDDGEEGVLAEAAAMMMRAPSGQSGPATPPATARITSVSAAAPPDQAAPPHMDALVTQVYEIIKRKLTAEAERLPR